MLDIDQFNKKISVLKLRDLKIIGLKQQVLNQNQIQILQKYQIQRIHQYGLQISLNNDYQNILRLIAWISSEQVVIRNLGQTNTSMKIYHQFSDINFFSLQVLSLSGSHCLNVQFLQKICFPNLKKLNLAYCDIVNVKSLTKMSCLKLYNLNLNKNQIRNIETLSKANFQKRMADISISSPKQEKQWILKCAFQHVNYFLEWQSKQINIKIKKMLIKKYENCTFD